MKTHTKWHRNKASILSSARHRRVRRFEVAGPGQSRQNHPFLCLFRLLRLIESSKALVDTNNKGNNPPRQAETGALIARHSGHLHLCPCPCVTVHEASITIFAMSSKNTCTRTGGDYCWLAGAQFENHSANLIENFPPADGLGNQVAEMGRGSPGPSQR